MGNVRKTEELIGIQTKKKNINHNGYVYISELIILAVHFLKIEAV